MANLSWDDHFYEKNYLTMSSDVVPLDIEMACMELEGIQLYKDFYYSLLKQYVNLVSRPSVLERLVRKVFREEPFCSHFTTDILRDIINDLQGEYN